MLLQKSWKETEASEPATVDLEPWIWIVVLYFSVGEFSSLTTNVVKYNH